MLVRGAISGLPTTYPTAYYAMNFPKKICGCFSPGFSEKMKPCGREDLFLCFVFHLILVKTLLRGQFRPTFSKKNKGMIVQKRVKTHALYKK